MSDRFVVLSGCSGGGKSTLLAELKRRGFSVVEESGRRVVREQLALGGDALPWRDLRGFLDLVIETALADREMAGGTSGWVFFDRSLVDAASALEALGVAQALSDLCGARTYHRRVFFAPPWPEIYVDDAERRHDYAESVSEYERLARAYPALGYEVIPLPRTTVAARADFVLRTLSGAHAI